jgi:hypothetical protein
MRGSRPPALLQAAIAAVGACAFLGVTATAQTEPAGQLTHVVCVTNETADAVTLWIKESPEAPGPVTGFGAAPNVAPYCYRRTATPGRPASVAISGQTATVEEIRTAEDLNRLAAQMTERSQQPPACEISSAMIDEADVEARRAVLVRVYAGAGAPACEVSAGAAPVGADGLEAFQTTRAGGPPVYYESAERESFPLCVVSSREAAAWPRVQPALPEDFLPREHVTRTSGSTPWCSRQWIPAGSTLVVALGGIRARHEADSPDFTDACTIGRDVIEQARAGERTGVFVRIARQRGRLTCTTSVEAAPESALGLGAFNPAPTAGD